MRQKGESASLAERLNNALAQQHAQKLAFEAERAELEGQLERAKEEAERLRGKNRELRRGREEQGGDGEGEQAVLKINHYLTRLQESARQMAQVANECRVFDAEIERASALIERNILKTASGLQKYVQELVKQWIHRETLTLQNQRLEKENRHLFELTTKLQQNFKETDRLIKQISRGGEDARGREYAQEARGRVGRLEEEGRKEGELEEKIARLGEKVRSLEQENATIKNIHTRTMKKLQKLQERNREKEEGPIEGQGLQDERRRWLHKTQEMHQQVRRLTKELILAEESERKVREQLAGVLEIYSQWEAERQERKAEIDKLRQGMETYLERISELEAAVSERRGEVEAMAERLEVSEGEKEKIVGVYQLEVQELNDLLFKKQDALTEIDALLTREHARLEELKKQHIDLTKYTQNLEDNSKKAASQIADLRETINIQEQAHQKLTETLLQADQKEKQLKADFQKQKNQLLAQVESHQRQKQELALIVQEYKHEYYSASKEMAHLMEEEQTLRDEQFSVKQELKSMLGLSDDSLDVWALLAQQRDHLQALASENSSLKDSQRTLLMEMESRSSEAARQLEEVTNLYESAKQGQEDQRKNDEFILKMLKMKVAEKQICKETASARVNSFKELLQLVINAFERKENPTGNQQDQQQMDKLYQQLFAYQQNEKQLKKELAKAHQEVEQAKRQVDSLKKMHEEAERTRKEAEESLQQVMRQLEEEKQLKDQLTEDINALREEREATNKEMVGLASELNKLHNEMEDFQEEKSSIQGKLEHAKEVHLRNQQLEENILQLYAKIESMSHTIRCLQQSNKALETNNQHLQTEIQNKKTTLEQSNIQHEQVHEEEDSELLQNDQQKSQQKPRKDKEEQQYLVQINNLLNENNDLQADISEKDAKIDQLQHSLILLTQNHQLQNEKMERMEHQIQSQQEQLKEIEQQLKRKAGEAEQYRKICIQLESERDNLTALRQQLMAEREEAHQKDMENSQEYIQLTLNNEASMQQIDHLELQVHNLQAQLQQKVKIITSLQQELEKAVSANHISSNQRQDMLAREEELKISLTKIHQKEAELLKEAADLQAQRAKLANTEAAVRQQEQHCILKHQELIQRQKYLNLHEQQLLKKEEEINKTQQMQEKEGCFQHSHLGMESLRQSKEISQEPSLQQLKEELNRAKQTIREKEFNCGLKESELDELILQQKNDQTKIQRYQREVVQLEEEITEYRQHSQHLQSALHDLTQKKDKAEQQSIQLRKEKEALEASIKQLDGLLEQSTLTNRQISQKNQSQKQAFQTEINTQNQTIAQYEAKLQQHEAATRQLSSFLAQKQQQIQKIQAQLQDKEKLVLKSMSELNLIRTQNQQLLTQIDETNIRCLQAQREAAAATQQNQQYAERLEEIEDLMEALRKEEADGEILREKLEQTLVEKQRLEEMVAGMENAFGHSSSNMAIFQKRNQELTEELTASHQQQEALKMNAERVTREAERLRESLSTSREALAEYQKIGNIAQISAKLENYSICLKQNDEIKQRYSQTQRINSILKGKVQALQSQLSLATQKVNQNAAYVAKATQECKQLKEELRKTTLLHDQNEHLTNKFKQLQQDLDQCKEELKEREAKIAELKELHARQVTQRELLQAQLRERTLDWQNLQQEAQHYRQQVKRIGKEKAQAKGEAIKSKYSLEEQQRIKEEEQLQLIKSSSQKEELIRQMKQEIESLKEQNSQLQEMSQIDAPSRPSRGSSTAGFSPYDDMPLQMPSRTRQKSAAQERLHERIECQGEQERGDKVSTRLRDSERTNLSLNSEVEALRGELRGKQTSMDSLERQFKTKVEDYSKLQRIVESLRDELNLERKRVKNFEDLYQSIQEKRIKISQPKATD